MTPELIDVLNRACADLIADDMSRSCRDWLERIVDTAVEPSGAIIGSSGVADQIFAGRRYLRQPDDFNAIAQLEPILEVWQAIRSSNPPPPAFERDWQRFENTTGDRRAYWAIRVTGGEYELHWGRISSKGQRKRKPYYAEGPSLMESLMASKLNRGYERIQPRHQLYPASWPSHRKPRWHRSGELLPRRDAPAVAPVPEEDPEPALARVQCRRCSAVSEAVPGEVCQVRIEGSRCQGALLTPRRRYFTDDEELRPGPWDEPIPDLGDDEWREAEIRRRNEERDKHHAAWKEKRHEAKIQGDPLKALAASLNSSVLGTARFSHVAAPVVEKPCPCPGCDVILSSGSFCEICSSKGCSEWVEKCGRHVPELSFTCGCKACTAPVHHKDRLCDNCNNMGCSEAWPACGVLHT